MKKLTILLNIFFAISSSFAQKDKTIEELIPVVSDIHAVTKNDDGKFWNTKYETPILFVNPENRQAIAFDGEKEPYITQLDESVPIGNTRSSWNGKIWAMVGIPLPEQPFFRENLILHEMFHVLQPQLDLDSLYEMPCAHLEKEEGRVLLRLELQALLKALEQSNNKDSMYYHLTSALTFRNSRYSVYPKAKEEENYVELNEGITEYTSIMMIQRYSPNNLNNSQLVNYFKSYVSALEQDKSYVRSFAYITIALYGFLIQMDFPSWHQKVTKKTNLTDYFMQMINGGDNEWKTLGLQYNYNNIAKEENLQMEQIDADRKAITEKFLCVNRVEISLALADGEYNYTFDPFNYRILDSVGEFHNNITITGGWGKVEASNGLILDKEDRKVFLSPIIKTENNIIFGDGWVLHLNDGYGIEEKGDWVEVVEK